MTSTAKPPIRRGQALVLSALGMVLLVLMVCMTLSFGTRAKSKMEVQIVADQAAYSTAVAVARSYNVLALTNRVMMAHMTAMLGIQSAISFSSIWFAIVWQMTLYYAVELVNQSKVCNPCPFCPMCPYYGAVVLPFMTFRRIIPAIFELIRLYGSYMGLDALAAQQARRTGFASMMLYVGQTETVSNRLYNAVNDQGVAQRVVTRSMAGAGTMRVEPAGGKVARRETGFPFAFPFALAAGAINQTNLIASDRHAVMAAMGARGHPFTANRWSLSVLPNGVVPMLRQAANMRIGGAANDLNTFRNLGNAYFGGTNFLHQNTMLSTNSTLAMSDDHNDVGSFIRYTGPRATSANPWPMLVAALVASNLSTGYHAGGFGIVIQTPVGPNPVPMPVIVVLPISPFLHNTHQVTSACLANCPSAWSNFVDYNLVKVMDADDNFGQPKLPVTVFKDVRDSPPDPFNLMFNFRFGPGPGEDFNLQNGSQGSGGAGNGMFVRDGAGRADISRQMGYSTGIAYYHRAGHWKEPPNMFNPYWRAGITRADTDRRANGTDIEATLTDSGASYAARAFTTLLANGFKGTP